MPDQSFFRTFKSVSPGTAKETPLTCRPLEKWKKCHAFYLYFRFSTTSLAKYLNVSRRTIDRWVKGEKKPNRYKQALICEYLRVVEKVCPFSCPGLKTDPFIEKSPVWQKLR